MKSISNGLIIDGFVRKPSTGSGIAHSKVPKIPASRSQSSTKPAARKLKYTAQTIHQRAQRSQTLMRNAVQKPKQMKDTQGKKISLRTRSFALDTARATRASSVTKNSAVRHFSSAAARTSPRGAKAEVATPVKATKKAAASASSSTKAVARPLPSLVTSVSHQHLERLLDQAFIRADAHKKSGNVPNHGLWQRIKSAPHWLTIGASILIIALAAGFYAWKNVPQVAMRVAATRADVKASVPGYTPSGFSYSSPISYSSGSVTMNYKAQSDSARTFSLTQKKSNMTSKSLAASTLPKNAEVQTSQVDGTTVYVYGTSNNATWVNHGIQYTIDDKATLNTEQLLKIAGSL